MEDGSSFWFMNKAEEGSLKVIIGGNLKMGEKASIHSMYSSMVIEVKGKIICPSKGNPPFMVSPRAPSKVIWGSNREENMKIIGFEKCPFFSSV